MDANHPRLGPQLILNGTFDADANWSKGTGWTIGSGVASRTNVGSSSNLFQTATEALVNGVRYFVQYDLVSRNSGTVHLAVGTSIAGTFGSAPGTYSGIFAHASGSGINVVGDASFAGSVDNVIFKRLPAGAVQSRDGSWWAPLKPSITIDQITATGTPSTTTYLAGDGSWKTPSGGGGGGTVETIVNGTGIAVNAADPANPIVSLANMATATLKGRAAGAGTGAPQDLTAAQVRSLLNVKALNADGGFTFATTAAPTETIETIFGGTWRAPHVFQLNTTGAHAGSPRFAFAATHRAEGSGGDSGAVNLDAAAWFEASKKDALTDQTINGPITTMFVVGQTNAWSDLGGVIVNMQKVMTDTPGTFGAGGGVNGNGSIVCWESTARAYEMDGVTMKNNVVSYVGYQFSNLTPGSNGPLGQGRGAGFGTEMQVGTGFAAYFANGRTDLSGSPGFLYILVHSSNRNPANIDFMITGPKHAGGAGIIRAGNGDVDRPTFSFMSDPDLGFYRGGANLIAWAHSGINRGFFGDGFRVGIPTGGDLGSGTINIAGRFAVQGTTAIDAGGRVVKRITTTAALSSAANAINTTNKTRGVEVWNETNQLTYVSNGSTATAGWFPSNGGAAITPA